MFGKTTFEVSSWMDCRQGRGYVRRLNFLIEPEVWLYRVGLMQPLKEATKEPGSIRLLAPPAFILLLLFTWELDPPACRP